MFLGYESIPLTPDLKNIITIQPQFSDSKLKLYSLTRTDDIMLSHAPMAMVPIKQTAIDISEPAVLSSPSPSFSLKGLLYESQVINHFHRWMTPTTQLNIILLVGEKKWYYVRFGNTLTNGHFVSMATITIYNKNHSLNLFLKLVHIIYMLRSSYRINITILQHIH